jgi:hypothetical protein
MTLLIYIPSSVKNESSPSNRSQGVPEIVSFFSNCVLFLSFCSDHANLFDTQKYPMYALTFFYGKYCVSYVLLVSGIYFVVILERHYRFERISFDTCLHENSGNAIFIFLCMEPRYAFTSQHI